MRIQPYRTMDNVIEGAVLTFVDITESRRLQKGLQMNAEWLRIALSAASIAVFTQDLDLRYTWIHPPNPGFAVYPIIGKIDADLLPKQEAVELTAIKQQVLVSEQGVRKIVQTTLAGKIFVYDLTIEPFRDGAGTVVGITCVALDVTGQQSGVTGL